MTAQFSSSALRSALGHVLLRFGKGAGGSGPCNPGGASPSLHNDLPCITGPIFTGPELPMVSRLQVGFLEPKRDTIGVPASSGSIQSFDLTKAHSAALFPIPLLAAVARERAP